MPASQPANFNLQEFSDAGLLLLGGRLYTYAYGTTAQKTAYTDPAGTVPHTYTPDGLGGQYIALNARGELPAPLYLAAGSYDIALKRGDGSTVWTRKADGVGDVFAFIASLASSIGASLIGFIQAGAGAVAQSVQTALRERISITQFGTGTGQGDVAKDTAAILAAVAAVKQAFYDKGSAELYFPTPTVPYRLNATIDLSEVWNLTLSTGNGFLFQRFNGAVDPLTDNALIHWYGAAGGVMMRLHYTFGMASDKVTLNGRGLAKIGIDVAPATSIASVTRKVDLNDLGIKNCDFGVRVGDLAAQTDNAPVNINRPHISGCTSCAVLVASGNAAVNITDPFFINNGYAPTVGNAFIADADNIGSHLTILAGFVGVTNWTSDHDATHVIAGAAIYQTAGSLRVNGAWVDDPNKPFYKGSADRALYFNGVTHYDGGMTLASTPDSIVYNGPQPMVLESCYLYGNVNITSGNQASVIDLGTVFVRAGAGYTGNMVTTYGGLSRTAKTGNNSLAQSIGGDFPSDIGGNHSMTVWSDSNLNGLVRAMRGAFTYKVTESLNNGQMFVAGNAYFDGVNWRAIKAGQCWRHAYSVSTEIFDKFTAAAAGDVITWASSHGWLPGVGGNAIPILTADGQKMSWDSIVPVAGAWKKGDRVFNMNAAVGSPKGWVCTVTGTPGTWVSEGNL